MTDQRPKIQVGAKECPSPHSFRNKVGRVLWGVVWATLFRCSPRFCFGWRRCLLRCFGAKIGKNARISPSVHVWAPWNLTVGEEAAIAHHVDCYCVAAITIGDHATVSQYSFLCSATHDVTDPHMELLSAPIEIGDQAWVCAGAWILPGKSIGEGAVVGARSLVTTNVKAWTIVAGHPARFIKERVLRDHRGDL